jgi:alkylated DNA repair dioxygenase AlkB
VSVSAGPQSQPGKPKASQFANTTVDAPVVRSAAVRFAPSAPRAPVRVVWPGRCARYQICMESPAPIWQPSLFGQGKPHPDPDFSGLTRHQLDETAWVDHVAGWLDGADALFDDLMRATPWEATTQELYGKIVVTPRLVARWSTPEDIRALPAVIERMRALLVQRYKRPFDSVGANLYRDGRDSVAWHGDHIPLRIVDPAVATVSLGNPRRFLMRPREGKTALSLSLGMGDLVVMGGSSQRTWLHTVPKVASSGPRISVAYRHSTG